MLSLDEPLDLKVPRGRVGGRDRGAMSPSTLTPSPIHAKGAGQLRMADDGTAVIIPASPASPHTGKQEGFSITSNITAGSVTEMCVCRCPAGQVRDPHTARCGPQHVPVLPQHRLLSGSLQRKRLSSHFPRGESTTLGKSTTWILRRTFKSKYTSTIYASKNVASFLSFMICCSDILGYTLRTVWLHWLLLLLKWEILLIKQISRGEAKKPPKTSVGDSIWVISVKMH